MKLRNSQNEQLGNIWDVVSNLAKALTDARDQLVGLINSSATGVTRSAGSDKGLQRNYGKENTYHSDDNGNDHHELARYRGGGYIPRRREPRSIHRAHVRGHVAFGIHSEFKPMPPSKCKPKRRSSSRGKGGKKGTQFGLFLDSKSNSVQVKTRKGCKSPVCINLDYPDPGLSNKGSNCRPSSPDSKRHCIGTQYAALLKEEASRIRERRLSEEKDPRTKTKWTRC